MAQTSADRWRDLSRELSARVTALAPDWTGRPDSDPGITLVELFDFLGESLLSRKDLSASARARLGDVLERLDRAEDPRCEDGVVTRNRYFTGRLLGTDDFEQEQTYHRTKNRRHNRLFHGVGIVRGLSVALEPRAGGDPDVVVSPGVAIGPDGDELVLCEPVSVDVCTSPSTCYVMVALVEQPAGPLPDGESSRIEESAAVATAETVPDGYLAIARLRQEAGAWRIDSGYKAPRVR